MYCQGMAVKNVAEDVQSLRNRNPRRRSKMKLALYFISPARAQNPKLTRTPDLAMAMATQTPRRAPAIHGGRLGK